MNSLVEELDREKIYSRFKIICLEMVAMLLIIVSWSWTDDRQYVNNKLYSKC